MVASKAPILLHVADHRLNGGSSLQLALGHRRKATVPARDEDLLVFA
jgi:hypothetical protein